MRRFPDDESTGLFSDPPHPFGGVTTSTGTVPTARFPGQWFQSESGLYQNWMRDYDPTTGRYLQADPLGLVDGASVYGYVTQSPMMLTDPTGEFIPLVIPAATAAVVAGSAAAYYFFLYICPEISDYFLNLPHYTWPTIPVVTQQKTPNEGAPGSTHVNPGSGQTRKYGPDGKPLTDVDYDHDHGQGTPHAHDWEKGPDGQPVRGPGRPLKPGEQN